MILQRAKCRPAPNVLHQQFAAVSSGFQRFRAVSCSSSPGRLPPPPDPPRKAPPAPSVGGAFR
eukprot:577959-Alexandrium_andersonii.AAC.1